MNALCRVSAINVMKLNSRNFVTRTRSNRGGSAAGHGHDDHHHHEHKLWETLPFKKGPTALMVFGGAAFGTGLIVFACWLQNWKHGFLAKKE